MATYSTNEFKNGLKIMLDNDPCTIVENEFVKPGKGQAFNRVKIRNLKTGRVVERTFKSGESVEAADVIDTDMQYLYNDGEFFHFMVPETFEQYAATSEAVGDARRHAPHRDPRAGREQSSLCRGGGSWTGSVDGDQWCSLKC